jgi:hypothetical protein
MKNSVSFPPSNVTRLSRFCQAHIHIIPWAQNIPWGYEVNPSGIQEFNSVMKPIYYSTGEYGMSSLATEAMRMYHQEEEGYIPTSFFARVKALLAKAKQLEKEQADLLRELVREQKQAQKREDAEKG